MKNFKKFTAFVLALCMMFSLSVAAFAAEPETHTVYDSAPDEEVATQAEAATSGTIPGSKIKWELNEHNWLMISGSGDCDPFTSKDDQPWAGVRDQITHLFNNAGVWLDKSRVSLTDPSFSFDDVSRQFEVNAVGPLRVTRTFLPMLLVGSGKCIINLSSEAGSIGNAGRKCEYGYCMSKAALNMETKLLQNAYPELRFYAIHPGWMKTPQGYAGATKDCTPQQEPSDTAEKLLTLAETKKYPYLYGDFEGNPMPW